MRDTINPRIALGDNRPSFDAVVEEKLLRGLAHVHLEALRRCIKDPRLEHCHKLVLVALSECTNDTDGSPSNGMAYPGRAWLAKNIVYYVNGEARHYSERTIANAISDLIRYGYVLTERRAVAPGGRALAHYLITEPPLSELQDAIAKACAAIREAAARRTSRATRSASKVTVGGDLRGAKVTGDGDVIVDGDVSSKTAKNGSKVTTPGDLRGAKVTGDGDVIVGGDVTGGGDLRGSDVTQNRADVTVDGGTVKDSKINKYIPPTLFEPQELPLQEPDDSGQRPRDAIDVAFEEFWRVFPPGRKQGKGSARKAFRKVVTGTHSVGRASAQQLIDAAKCYAAARPNPKYVPLPSTWLNGGRWEDDICRPRAAKPKDEDYEDYLAQIEIVTQCAMEAP